MNDTISQIEEKVNELMDLISSLDEGEQKTTLLGLVNQMKDNLQNTSFEETPIPKRPSNIMEQITGEEMKPEPMR
jgi:poly(A) polymerase Pap1